MTRTATVRRRSVTRRRRDSRGSAIVEAAIIFPFLITIMLGIIEFGFALKDTTVVARSVQQAGRVAGNQATDRFVDYEALRVIDSALASLESGTVERVIIFDATSGITRPTAGCLAVAATNNTSPKGVAGECNVYGRTQVLNASLTGFNSTSAALDDCTAGSWDVNWCPPLRERESTTPDRVGIFIDVAYGQFTGIFPSTITLSETSIFQLEPCTVYDDEC